MFFFLLLQLVLPTTHASVEEAYTVFRSRGNYANSYLDVANHLYNDGLYFAAVPFVKEYLHSQKVIRDKARLDSVLDKLITKVGVRQFEALPHKILERSNSPSVRYIRAKKYFRSGKYAKSLEILSEGIPRLHAVKPYALFMEASIYTMKRKHPYANVAYQKCIDVSGIGLSKTTDPLVKRQLEINRDYCVVGRARNDFGIQKYKDASLTYLDLDKTSHVWPEILFEEAWTSFYNKNFNRTLGKLVTYKAPVLNHIFNPEIDVLRALTYLQLCLWGDANNEVEQFYSTYQGDANLLRDLVSKNTKNFKWFYSLSRDALEGRKSGNNLLDRILKDIVKSSAYLELVNNFQLGKVEIIRIKNLNMGKFKVVLQNNLKRALFLQRNMIGSFVKNRIAEKLNGVFDAFQHMSYIKLEVLNYKKTALYTYNTNKIDRVRGDIKYLQRNNKQYFWTFNGEFWADELGDYVFALKSVCIK